MHIIKPARSVGARLSRHLNAQNSFKGIKQLKVGKALKKKYIS